MPELLETLETIQAAEAGVARLFDRDPGERHVRGRNATNPRYVQSLAECARFIQEVLSGRRPAYHLQEAMTTSDFPVLFADILDRQLLADYQQITPDWRSFVRTSTVRDFRQVKRFTADGGLGLLPEVPEKTEYPEDKLPDVAPFTYSVTKKGKRFQLTWETIVDDDLGVMDRLPRNLATSARNSEYYFATGLFVSSSGPNSTFFSSGHGNLLSANPTLSITSLQAAFTALAAQKDTDGNPILVDAVVLVVPPALQVVAENIINATEILAATGGGPGTGNDQLRVANWMRNKVTLVVNPWLPIIDTTHGSTSWYLLQSPGGMGRPIVEMGFLRGYEQPQLFMKASDAIRVGGGGETSPLDGDFDTDSVQYKVRHVFGGTLLDTKSAVASNGSGS